ncbi:MAG: aldo/keto reductase [Anaerolineae bacterium]|nr:aldo/keto reductase [Anaerolineae bacterium]
MNVTNQGGGQPTLAWGILGTGRIARTFARDLGSSQTGRLVAVGSRTLEAAERFGDEYAVPRRYGSYEALLADGEVEAVYISLPNHLHLPWTLRSAEAGKHILCEKPLACNLGEAMVMVEAARRHDVFLMEAFMYRCHPQMARLVGLIREGAIGQVRLIEASFCFDAGQPEYQAFRHQSATAGGSIMDVGCYTVSASRLIAGAATGQDFADPIELKGCGHIDPIGRVDEWAVACARFPGDILANLSCGMLVRSDSALRVFGSAGHIVMPNPWFGRESGDEILVYRVQDREPERLRVDGGAPLYAIEADVVARHVAARQAPSPCMSWADSLGNMETLDRWRKEIGLVFDNERPQALIVPFSGRPLARRPDHAMRYGRVDGIDLPVSRLVMGTMVLAERNLPFACALLDHFVELGGNCLDTAYVYRTEGIVGQWLKLRGNRRQVVLIAKGAHTPHCDPESLTRQLYESLDRFGTDYVDLYLMHRDNPGVPVGEFVDCLNEHRRAGRIRAFGGSNWTIERLEAANAYARARGLAGFAASSPNLALAVWNEPAWEGCLSADDAASRAWYGSTQMPLFAWSSQAGGFFSGRFRPGQSEDPALCRVARVWFNDGNWRRLARAQELGERKGASALQVALAYVLCQPLNVFALIGPRSIEETRTSVQALGIALTPQELRWLNLEEDTPGEGAR